MTAEPKTIPKEVVCTYHAPGRRVLELAIVARIMPVPGVLATITRVLADYNVRILSLNFTSRGDMRYVTMFADFTKARAPVDVIVSRLRELGFVKDVVVSSEGVSDLLIDVLAFPPTTDMGKTRLVLFSAELFSKLLCTLYTKFGTGGAALVFHEGRLVGEMLASRLGIKPRSSREVVARALKVLQAMGLGIPEVVRYDPSTPYALIRVINGFEPLACRELGEPSCHYTRGMLAGFFSKAWGVSVRCRELKCVGAGDDFCEFEVTSAELTPTKWAL